MLSGILSLILAVVELAKDIQAGDKQPETLLDIGNNSALILVILSLLAVSIVGIGAFLVNRLRVFFKSNYFRHSQTIIAAICLQGAGVSAMLCMNFIIIRR